MRFLALVLVVQPDELVAVQTVERQDEHDDEIRCQQRDIESAEPVEVFEGLVGVVRLPIVAEPLRSQRDRENIGEGCGIQKGQCSGERRCSGIVTILRDLSVREFREPLGCTGVCYPTNIAR